MKNFKGLPKSEIFSKALIPLETPILLGLTAEGFVYRYHRRRETLRRKVCKMPYLLWQSPIWKGFNPAMLLRCQNELNLLFDGKAHLTVG